MTDQSSLQPGGSGGDTTTYERPGDSSVEAAPGATGDYRDQLRSRRWDAAPLENPEVEKTEPRIAVAAVVVLSAITLVVVVLGYSSGFWG